MNDFLILVDQNDKPYGKLEKLLVHQLGLLHRAFSIFIFNSKGELLLQQRADEKYHSAGLWTNTCCSHPSFGEDLQDAVNRRLEQEMGITCDLKFIFSFIYEEKLDHELTEHEYDHVFFGFTDDDPTPDPAEVKDWKYMNLTELESDIKNNPDHYTVWMKICLPQVKKQLELLYFDNKNG